MRQGSVEGIIGVVKQWDAFISYASEDRDTVALPLRDALAAAGLDIWLDRVEIQVGDSLQEKIDAGLARSRFGIIVLSPSFLAKRWPRRELNGLLAREEGGSKVLLPVWHCIDKAALLEYSPIVADRVAASTADGIPEASRQIVRAVLAPGAGSPSEVAPGVGVRLSRLVDDDAPPASLRAFLAAHIGILEEAGTAEPGAMHVWLEAAALPSAVVSVAPDVCIGNVWATRNRRQWQALFFDAPSSSTDTPADRLARLRLAEARVADFRGWIDAELQLARRTYPDIASDLFATVVLGRRMDAAASSPDVGPMMYLLLLLNIL